MSVTTGTVAAIVKPPKAAIVGSTMVNSQLDSIRGCADQARKCVEWARASQVTIRTSVDPSGRLGGSPESARINTDLVMPRRWPVRQPTGREITSSGGRLNIYSVVVTDISPAYVSHGGGGFTPAQLDPGSMLPIPCNDTEILYLLNGDVVGVFSLYTSDFSDPTSWSLFLNNTRLSP